MANLYQGGPLNGSPFGPLTWRTSSKSQGTNCVEVAADVDAVFVRDSKDRGGPVLGFSRQEWSAFLSSLKSGDLVP